MLLFYYHHKKIFTPECREEFFTWHMKCSLHQEQLCQRITKNGSIDVLPLIVN